MKNTDFFLVINKLKLTVCGTIVAYLTIVISDVIIHIVVNIYVVNKLKVNNSIPIVTLNILIGPNPNPQEPLFQIVNHIKFPIRWR